MTIERFMLWFDFGWCVATIAVILYFVHSRRDALNPMRWGRIMVFAGLATIYGLGLLEVLDARLNVIVSRFFIVPTCVVLGMLPSAFRVREPGVIVVAGPDPDALVRLEATLKKALGE